MFELITISNGVAVVQHTPSGHVYRFRPKQPGLWESLTLNTIDARSDRDHGADHHAAAAHSFAEHATASCSTTAVLAGSTETPRPGDLLRLIVALTGRLGRCAVLPTA